MDRLIVNEGQGPRSFDLVVGRMVVGSTPDCDVRLKHVAAAGCQFVVERTLRGHRAVRLTGELLINEQPCEVADLAHNDTLRVGESMILYKSPDAVTPRRAAAPPPTGASRAGSPPASELPDVETLGAVEEVEELDELEALEDLEELVELEEPEASAKRAAKSLEELPVLEERAAVEAPPAAQELEDLPALDELEEFGELVELPPPQAAQPTDAPTTALLPSPARPQVGRIEPPPPAPSVPLSREGVRVPGRVESGTSLASRFRRPLPPGHAAPTSPPPADPGPPPVRPLAS